MLVVVQIISILQGIFLLVALYKKRKDYQLPVFSLFCGCIISIVLFSFGDDDYNLLFEESKWFLFHEPLIVSFIFLFVRYSNTNKKRIEKLDILFFIPFALYAGFEYLSNSGQYSTGYVEVISDLLELSFILMLLYAMYLVFRLEKNKWLLIFLIPFTLIYGVDAITGFYSETDHAPWSLDSYGVMLSSVFLFYIVSYKLIIAPDDLLPAVENSKYRASRLSKSQIATITNELNRLMGEEKIFTNQKLSVEDVAKRIGIPRQQLSEVLNVHMGIRFQDLLNQYRIEEFIECLESNNYSNYTIFGIASEVGFSSKSSFNAIFKKLKGMTPSQYSKESG